MSAWETVWLCTALAVLVLILDAWSSTRVSGDLADQVRDEQRKRRMNKLNVGPETRSETRQS